jgi:hypothetical protein
VCDIFKDIWVEGLVVSVEDHVAVYVSLKHVATIYKAALLSLKASPFVDICYNLGLFCLSLFCLNAVPAVN